MDRTSFSRDATPVRHLLVIDDDPDIRDLLRRVLVLEGYRVSEAGDGAEAFATIGRELPDLILLDLDLPDITGYEICRRLKQSSRTRMIPVVIVTAQTELNSRVDAWNDGADEYLTKPFRLLEVLARCRSLLRIKELVEQRDEAEAVVFALARTIEAKSPYTLGHSERVTANALMLALSLELSLTDQELLKKGGLLHDIGKLATPDAILNKPGPLTDGEMDEIRAHPMAGVRIVESLVSMRPTLPLIRWHHERLDGTGYPDHIGGSEIPLLVRILSVADVYDSLASDRPYRARLPHAACLKIMQENAASGGLDADLVARFQHLTLNRP